MTTFDDGFLGKGAVSVEDRERIMRTPESGWWIHTTSKPEEGGRVYRMLGTWFLFVAFIILAVLVVFTISDYLAFKTPIK